MFIHITRNLIETRFDKSLASNILEKKLWQMEHLHAIDEQMNRVL